MSTLLGIDTGGTFTDAVIMDDEHNILGTAKSPTTKHDLTIGIRNVIEAVLPKAKTDIQLVSLSTTLATNAIVEGQGSPVCLLLLGYDPDFLDGENFERIRTKNTIVHIGGGHNLKGDEQAPLDVKALKEAIVSNASKVSAFAISGYFGVLNPTHELEAKKMVRELTGLPVTCGHELTSNLNAPVRAVTTALNARLIFLMQKLILSVKSVMEHCRIEAPLMIVKGDGSLIG
ncbi:MAG: hydantoinase/oxoprolinase family protein, partial [Proteobacteria bacterium]|nr:hydantoinase/oxoprolinase family protein [Pseudomonadota bacterium]